MGFARTDCPENDSNKGSAKRPRDKDALGHSSDISQKNLDLLTYDMKNFVNTRYPGPAVDDIDEMVWDFARKYPGYQKTHGIDSLKQFAVKMKERGWK